MTNQSTTDDELVFAGEAAEAADDIIGTWKVLIADDEYGVHDVTKLALQGVVFEGREIEFIDAYSGKDAEKLILAHPDLAVVLLDVVMEDDDTGLGIVEFVRKKAKRDRVRIILRTGQPGHAPESKVVIDYDINDYKAKTELTAQKLLTSIISALRDYNHLSIIAANQQEIRGLYADLKAHSDNLETTVEERTRELEDLNTNLERLVESKTKLLIKQEKSAIIGRLLQGVVHNLRTPLTAIRGFNYIMGEQAKQASTEQITKYGRKIDEVCMAMEGMLERLMAKSRLDQVDRAKLVNINELLKNELELFTTNTFFKHRLQKEYSFDDTICEIPLVYSDISQVLHNLINNAMDAMCGSDDATITIQTRQDERAVYFDISDTGDGIADDKIELIFDPFFTTKPARGEEKKGEPTGTGLGLHSCLELLKPYGGELTVSTEVGRGSTFTVRLPKDRDDSESGR